MVILIAKFRSSTTITYLKHCISSLSTDTKVRVRFAPSPTGFLHLGGLRTALFNYLFARAHNGVFILRIEDTDRTRIVESSIDKLEKDLKWAGITIDEGPNQGGQYGPYLQSLRLDIYRENVKRLVDSGHAYHCFCSDRRLDIIRKDALRRREIPKYDNRCRHFSKEEVKSKLESGLPYCIRFKLTPLTTPWHDLIHGPIVRNICEIEGDPVIIKTDGYPTYHLANVVDDHYMKISHVLRGLEWQTSTPKHVLLYQAFNWEIPKFAHLPLLVNEDGTKLSKRHANVTVEAYRNAHIYPKTLINVLTISGGGFTGRKNPDETGCLNSLVELEKHFTLGTVSTNSCQLPITRIKVYNQMELQELIGDENSFNKLIENARDIILEKLPECEESLTRDYIRQVLQWSIKEKRISSLPDIVENNFMFLWVQPSTADLQEYDKEIFDVIPPLIKYVKASFDLPQSEFSSYLKDLSQQKNLNYPLVMKFLRTCLSGLKNGPSVWEIVKQIGNEEALKRLERAYSILFQIPKEATQ